MNVAPTRTAARVPPPGTVKSCATLLAMQRAWFYFGFYFSVPGGREVIA